MKRKKIILCEGDSWTAGDIVDPSLFGDETTHVNHIDNRPYRLPRVWPGKLEKKINAKILNTSISGSSNDGIVRRVVGNILYLLYERNYKPEDIFVIIGWTSPERKDFYFKDESRDSLETIYPHEYTKDYDNEYMNDFHKLYVSFFWNPEEYILRYIHQVLYINSFLKNLGIKFLFFNAFYETSNSIEFTNKNNFLNYIKNKTKNIEMQKIDENCLFKFEYLIKTIEEIYNNNFVKISYQEFINGYKNKINHNFRDYFKNYHPTELSHQLWADYLMKYIKL